MTLQEEKTALRTTFHLHPVYQEHCGKSADDLNIHCTNHKDVNCPVCRKSIDCLTLQSGDNFTYNFDRVKFVDHGGIINQIKHIQSEVNELLEAAMTPDIKHTMVELMDVLHSGESLVRIMVEVHGQNPNEALESVKLKNKERGYYETVKTS